MRTEHVSFPVDGVVVDATLTLPADAAPKPVPAVLTGAGLAGVKEMLMPDYRRDFAAGGVASLTFDYPGFGRSGGHPPTTRRSRTAGAHLPCRARSADR